MDIRVAQSPVAVRAGEVPVLVQDKGTALVTLIVSIEGMDPIQLDAVNKGRREDVVRLKAGRKYRCNLYIAAYRHGAYGPAYDALLKIDGKTIATASGSVPKGRPSDRGDRDFALVT